MTDTAAHFTYLDERTNRGGRLPARVHQGVSGEVLVTLGSGKEGRETVESGMELKPRCPYCGQNQAVVKAGLNRSGSQRQRCQACRRYFTVAPTPTGYDPTTRELAVRLYLEGMSFRGIAKVLRISHPSVINWVNAGARQLPAVVTDLTPTETVETDELFSFIGKKKSASTS
jgi:transposase